MPTKAPAANPTTRDPAVAMKSLLDRKTPYVLSGTRSLIQEFHAQSPMAENAELAMKPSISIVRDLSPTKSASAAAKNQNDRLSTYAQTVTFLLLLAELIRYVDGSWRSCMMAGMAARTLMYPSEAPSFRAKVTKNTPVRELIIWFVSPSSTRHRRVRSRSEDMARPHRES